MGESEWRTVSFLMTLMAAVTAWLGHVRGGRLAREASGFQMNSLIDDLQLEIAGNLRELDETSHNGTGTKTRQTAWDAARHRLMFRRDERAILHDAYDAGARYNQQAERLARATGDAIRSEDQECRKRADRAIAAFTNAHKVIEAYDPKSAKGKRARAVPSESPEGVSAKDS